MNNKHYLVKLGSLYFVKKTMRDSSDHYTEIMLVNKEEQAHKFTDHVAAQDVVDDIGGTIYVKETKTIVSPYVPE